METESNYFFYVTDCYYDEGGTSHLSKYVARQKYI